MAINNKNLKEKSLDLILLGLAWQFIPLIILGFLIENFDFDFSKISTLFTLIITLVILGLFLKGSISFIQGCRLYIKSKGYSPDWGWLGLLNILGLSFLLLIPPKKIRHLNENSLIITAELTDYPFDKINVLELLLSLDIGIFILFYIILFLIFSVNNWNFIAFLQRDNYSSLFDIILLVLMAIFLLIELQKAGFIINKFIVNFKEIKLKLILFIVIFKYSFAWGFVSLNLYYLSFIIPNYVQDFINKQYFTNTPEMIVWGLSLIIFAPLYEEFLCRGIILQKWSIKWGINSGILFSSLLFAAIHFRFDIIYLTFAAIIYSVLYFKTENLITPIICHSLHNTVVFIWDIAEYYSPSKVDFITLNDYRLKMQPLLGQKVIVAIISFAFLMVFLYRNFPKKDDIIPYHRNPK